MMKLSLKEKNALWETKQCWLSPRTFHDRPLVSLNFEGFEMTPKINCLPSSIHMTPPAESLITNTPISQCAQKLFS